MTYTFTNLYYPDFEDLARDLLGKKLGFRFEGFAPGPDGGIDGRHAKAGRQTILQAKHFPGSRFSTLKAVMKRERLSVDRLKPDRYILVTSAFLTPKNKSALAEVIGPALLSEDDIVGATELNALLREFPEVEKSNIKLWLSSTAILERILHSAAEAFTATTRSEIEEKVRVYAPNPSFAEAREKLDTNHVVIISGPPGVGKTTLAEMLAYSYIADEWGLVAIRSLDDGFSAIKDNQKQVFFFDDFLGRIALDPAALAAKDSEIAKFMNRVRNSKNARFILTTRAPLLQEARLRSEYLADPKLDITQYALDVGKYTRRIRARIFYNHLVVAGVPLDYIKALWDAGAIPRIVDHRNYNPRVIEAMTDSMRVNQSEAATYPFAFLEALEKPARIWDISFRHHISPMCRHLLYTLFFGSDYGMELDELRPAFEKLHRHMSMKYAIPFQPKDFEDAVKILEGGFIAIRSKTVSLINPSLRDYLASYIDDLDLLCDFASCAIKAKWAGKVWTHAGRVAGLPEGARKVVASHFIGVAANFPVLPVMKEIAGQPGSYSYDDMGLTERIDHLIEWTKASANAQFMEYAIKLAAKPPDGWIATLSPRSLVGSICLLRSEGKGLPLSAELGNALEDVLLKEIRHAYWGDDVENLWDAIQGHSDLIGEAVFEAGHASIDRFFSAVKDRVEDLDDEHNLDEELNALKALAPVAGVPPETLERAIAAVEGRKRRIKEQQEEASEPSLTSRSRTEEDRFGNAELAGLFGPLIGAEGAIPVQSVIDLDSEIPF